jgi:hypothetical protein
MTGPFASTAPTLFDFFHPGSGFLKSAANRDLGIGTRVLDRRLASAGATRGPSHESRQNPIDERGRCGPVTRLYIVISAEETSPQGNVQNDEDSTGAKSAKMGKDEGTQTGRANQSTPPETKTQKVEQPPQQKPTNSE